MKRKRTVATLAAVFLMVGSVLAIGVAPVAADAPSDNQSVLNNMSGSGTAEDPYIITNVEELQAINASLTSHYVLGNDINASGTETWNNGTGFTPIGGTFTGTLDGDSHEITDLYINRGSSSKQGLFSQIGSGSLIKNLGLVNMTVNGGSNTGTFVGIQKNGEIRQSYASEIDVSGGLQTGGLVGQQRNQALIIESYADGQVQSGSSNTGGLVGQQINTDTVGGMNGGTVKYSYSHVDLSGSKQDAGGIVGSQEGGGIVNLSYATGSIPSGDYSGGIVGSQSESYYTNSDQVITGSYWDTESTGQSSSIGYYNQDVGSLQNATGLSTSEMTGADSLSNMSWFDFQNTWAATESYPTLSVFKGSTEFTVDAVDIQGSSVAGDTVNVAANVTNVGNSSGAVSVHLAESGEEIGNFDIFLNSGNSTTVSHTVSYTDSDIGNSYTYIFDMNGTTSSTSTTVYASEGPYYVPILDSVTTDNMSLTANVSVENLGLKNTSKALNLTLNESTVKSFSVSGISSFSKSSYTVGYEADSEGNVSVQVVGNESSGTKIANLSQPPTTEEPTTTSDPSPTQSTTENSTNDGVVSSPSSCGGYDVPFLGCTSLGVLGSSSVVLIGFVGLGAYYSRD